MKLVLILTFAIVLCSTLHIWKDDTVNHLLINHHELLTDKALLSKRFEGAEHQNITNYGNLTIIEDIFMNGSVIYKNVSVESFIFRNALNSSIGTYGDIVSYAGDFFGPTNKDYIHESENGSVFNELWKTIWNQSDGICNIRNILKIFREEKEILINGLDLGKESYQIYKEMSHLRFGTSLTYEMLVKANWNVDHFGDYAKKTYHIIHEQAMLKAKEASDLLSEVSSFQNETVPKIKLLLEEAYAINAFADHYLTDTFSAGHLRTPRLDLKQFCDDMWNSNLKIEGGWLSLIMHGEDNRNGLVVQNEEGETWKTYGDQNYLSSDNNATWRIIRDAVQISRNEIYEIFLGKEFKYDAEKLIPKPTSNNTCALFKIDNNSNIQVRKHSKPCEHIPIKSQHCSVLNSANIADVISNINIPGLSLIQNNDSVWETSINFSSGSMLALCRNLCFVILFFIIFFIKTP